MEGDRGNYRTHHCPQVPMSPPLSSFASSSACFLYNVHSYKREDLGGIVCFILARTRSQIYIWFFLKSLLNLLQHCFCFMFWFFGLKAWGILAPRPRIKPSPCNGRQSLNQWPPGKSLNFSFCKESPYCFPYFMHHFTFPLTMHKDYLFTSWTLIFCRFDDSHSSMCEVISYSGLGLHFSDDY